MANKHTIVDYAQTELASFDEKSFNEVDSLVLSHMAYMYFDKIAPLSFKKRGVPSLFDLHKAEYFDGIFQGMGGMPEDRPLFHAVCASPRFRDIRLNYYTNVIDEAAEKQFAAMTFILPSGSLYVAFRGTDTTLVGWKENFNMAFILPVPAQSAAVDYLNEVASKTTVPLLVGGHSKGGNLAIYAAAMCKTAHQKRIKRIYSHDGPGFEQEFLSTPGFKRIVKRIDKTVPQSSLIGMLLNNDKDYRVIMSDGFFVMQHSPFTWLVEDGDFINVDGITGSADFINNSMHEWIASLSKERREQFVDALYTVLTASGTKDVKKFTAASIKSSVIAIKDMDPEMRSILLGTLNDLATAPLKNLVPKRNNSPEEDAEKA